MVMVRVCQVTGKSRSSGNSVSHSNIKTKRRFAELQTKRFILQKKIVGLLKVSARNYQYNKQRDIAVVIGGNEPAAQNQSR